MTDDDHAESGGDRHDLLAFLDEVRTIASNGRHWTSSPYDEERYDRLLDLASDYYSEALELPPEEVRDRLAADLGHVTPNVGGRAAVFDDSGRILLVRRSDDGTWGLPGGFTDPGEHPQETAVRETLEETGIEVEPVELVAVLSREADEHNPHGFVGHVYLCDVVGEGEAAHAHEIESIEYWQVENVPAWHANHDRSARAALDAWKDATSP